MLGRFFRPRFRTQTAVKPARISDALRLYAIGDIHGRLDLLNALLAQIEADLAAYPHNSRLIFLGDYIDRGPSSFGVIERLMGKLPGTLPPVFLMGNHEWAFLRLFHSTDTGKGWLEHGGMETLRSYGLPLAPGQPTPERLQLLSITLQQSFPLPHKDWLTACKPSYEQDDYLFVHAGIRPHVPLSAQNEQDFLWIREDFINWRGAQFERRIVHGHTISEQVVVSPHRIGIDTGAYRTGILTALCLEGINHRIIQTQG